MSVYAVGDLQGCYEPFLKLLKLIPGTPLTANKFIFLGDLINRGPKSLEILRYIYALGEKSLIILGNHDLHFLAVSQGIRITHVTDTLNKILLAPDCHELIEWLRYGKLAVFENHHLLFHAGVLPEWNMNQVIELAHEVEVVLRGKNWINFLRHMYNTTHIKWSNNLKGYDRLSCVVNALTRIRFCDSHGCMNFHIKEKIAPAGYCPWFEMPERKTQNVTCIFGHWSKLGLLLRDNLVGLDTGCIWGGYLTAFRLEDRALFQVKCY